ncbi:MAG: Uma2 family endonuclease [Pseudomonadota bacterium]
MGPALKQASYPTLQDYLDFEDDQVERHEFVNGVIYAMTGAKPGHNLIVGNIARALGNQVRRPCEVFSQSQKLLVSDDVSEDVFYPDVFMTCFESDRDDIFREHPCVIFEVLSPSTEREDRTGKLARYKTIKALETYVLVAQDMWHIEVFERAKGWRPRILQDGEDIDVCGGKAKVTAEAIYDEIKF